jgi:hypothetical protein
MDSKSEDNKKRILSLSFDPEKLKRRESALRAQGFEVKSVPTPGQARFEIEVGTCGILLTCRLVPDIVNRDLMDLFRRYRGPEGLIVLVVADAPSPTSPYEPRPDVRVPESRDPDGIVEVIRNRSQVSGAKTN